MRQRHQGRANTAWMSIAGRNAPLAARRAVAAICGLLRARRREVFPARGDRHLRIPAGPPGHGDEPPARRPTARFIVALALSLGVAAQAMAASQTRYAGNFGTNNFTQMNGPAGAVGSDVNTCAYRYSAGGHNGYWNTFGFSIPAGANIDGIEVEYMRACDRDPPYASSAGVTKTTSSSGTTTAGPVRQIVSAARPSPGEAILEFDIIDQESATCGYERDAVESARGFFSSDKAHRSSVLSSDPSRGIDCHRKGA